MKKILFIILASIIVSACRVYPPYSEKRYAGDLRNYTLEGFIISPTTAGFEYEPIAMIAVDGEGYFYTDNEGNVVDIKDGWQDLNTYYDAPRNSKNRKPVDWNVITERLVNLAKLFGADGILNFEIERVVRQDLVPEFVAKGFAVKIKKKGE